MATPTLSWSTTGFCFLTSNVVFNPLRLALGNLIQYSKDQFMGQYGSSTPNSSMYALAIGSLHRDASNLQPSDKYPIYGFRRNSGSGICFGDSFRSDTLVIGDYFARAVRASEFIYTSQVLCPISQYRSSTSCTEGSVCLSLAAELVGVYLPSFWFAQNQTFSLFNLGSDQSWVPSYGSTILPSVSVFFAMAQLARAEAGNNHPSVLLTVADISGSAESATTVSRTLDPLGAITALKDLARVYGSGNTDEEKFAYLWINASFNQSFPSGLQSTVQLPDLCSRQ